MGGTDRSGSLPMAFGDPPFPHDDVAVKLRQMHLRDGEPTEAGPYPERPGEPDCAFYMRSGLCKFGMMCKFNHPPDRNLVVATARLKGEYPERFGQPECQYYLKTGTCRFGATCKFHHPKGVVNIAHNVQLNMLGYPLRPNEIECSYYIRTGQCKFGSTCKFHHPQPASLMLSVHGSPIHPSVHPPTTAQSYQGGLTNWSVIKGTSLQSPQRLGNSSHNQSIFTMGTGYQPTTNATSGQLHFFPPMENTNEMLGGNMQQRKIDGAGDQGPFSSYNSSAVSADMYSFQGKNMFPERPGEPECQFYMKTGDCKFGSACRFHHPRERSLTIPDCILSPLGLPLRPGEPLCVFYSRYGICKFGPNCKFDHPMENSTNGIPTSPSAEASIEGQLLGMPSSGGENPRPLKSDHLGLGHDHADEDA